MGPAIDDMVDLHLLRQWLPMLDLFFESMESGLRQLNSLARQAESSPTPQVLESGKIRSHALKGASRLVGLGKLASLLEELEMEFDFRRRYPGAQPRRPLLSHLAQIEASYQEAKRYVTLRLEKGDGCTQNSGGRR